MATLLTCFAGLEKGNAEGTIHPFQPAQSKRLATMLTIDRTDKAT